MAIGVLIIGAIVLAGVMVGLAVSAGVSDYDQCACQQKWDAQSRIVVQIDDVDLGNIPDPLRGPLESQI